MDLQSELKRNMKESSGYLIASDPSLYRKVIQELINPFKNKKIDKIVAPESKGLFYGPTVAYNLNKPFVAIFKSGRVPKNFVVSKKFKDYSKKVKSIDIGKISIKKGERILIIDDVFESGQSGKAAINLIERLKGKVVGISVIYNKLTDKDEKFFKKYNFNYLVKMNS